MRREGKECEENGRKGEKRRVQRGWRVCSVGAVSDSQRADVIYLSLSPFVHLLSQYHPSYPILFYPSSSSCPFSILMYLLSSSSHPLVLSPPLYPHPSFLPLLSLLILPIYSPSLILPTPFRPSFSPPSPPSSSLFPLSSLPSYQPCVRIFKHWTPCW